MSELLEGDGVDRFTFVTPASSSKLPLLLLWEEDAHVPKSLQSSIHWWV